MRPRPPACWLAVTVAGLLLAGCDSGSPAASASPTPSSASIGVFGPLTDALAPPPAPPQASSAAGTTVLSAAAAKTAASGSFRIKITAQFTDVGTGRVVTISGAGESESPARTHMALTVQLPSGRYSSETAGYDGKAFSRTNGGAWTAASGTAGDPHNLLNYSNSATGITDLGPGDRNSKPAEKYGATITLAQRTPSSTATPAGPSTTRMVAWLDKATGQLIGEDIIPTGGGIGAGQLQVDFSDFGAPIKVTPPDLPASPAATPS